MNIVFLLAKYHIHCCKWRDSRPCFEHFMNEFELFYSSLRLFKKCRTTKISSDMSKFLVFKCFFFFFCLTCIVDSLKVLYCMLLYLVLYYAVTSMSYSILFNKKKKKKKITSWERDITSGERDLMTMTIYLYGTINLNFSRPMCFPVSH